MNDLSLAISVSGVLAHIAQNAAIGFMVKLAASMLEVGSAATKSAGDVDALGKKVSALDGLVAKVKFVLIVEGLSLLLDIGNAHRDAMKAEYEADAMRRKTIDTMREQQTAAYGLSLANQEYAGTAIKSAQEFAALGDTQKQAYLNALEGARQYEASLVRMAALERGQLDLMSESEKKTIDYAAAVKDADAAMEEHGAKVREISAELARYGIESESAAVRELVGVGNISKFDYPSEEAMKANHRETASLVEQIGMGCEPAAWHVDGKGGVGNSRPMISYKRPIVCGFQNGEEVPWSWGSSDEIMYAQTISLSHVSLRGISMISLPRINEKPRMLNQLAIGKDDEKAIKMAGISAYEKIKSKIGGWTAVYTGPDEKGEWSAYVSRDGETMIFPIPGK